MTFNEWIIKADEYRHAHPEQRFGQAYMNSLTWCNDSVLKALPPELDVWEVERGTDERINLFIDFVWENW